MTLIPDSSFTFRLEKYLLSRIEFNPLLAELLSDDVDTTVESGVQ
jgi:hypothetical protein